jgi:hypothetical protein
LEILEKKVKVRINSLNQEESAWTASKYLFLISNQMFELFPKILLIIYRTKEVFIVDCNNHRIQVYHLYSLAFVRQIGSKSHPVVPSSGGGNQGSSYNNYGSLNYAVGICMDESKQIFVADTNNHRIAVFNHITGVFIREISSQGSLAGYLSSPYGVCVDLSTGWLFVADYDNNRVQIFDKETGGSKNLFPLNACLSTPFFRWQASISRRWGVDRAPRTAR